MQWIVELLCMQEHISSTPNIKSQEAVGIPQDLLQGGPFEIVKRTYVTYKFCSLIRIETIVDRGVCDHKQGQPRNDH